jgi:hypothetical protein
LNGANWDGIVLPTAVIAKLFVLLSMKVLDWQVNKLVPAIAVSGSVGTVIVVDVAA